MDTLLIQTIYIFLTIIKIVSSLGISFVKAMSITQSDKNDLFFVTKDWSRSPSRILMS